MTVIVIPSQGPRVGPRPTQPPKKMPLVSISTSTSTSTAVGGNVRKDPCNENEHREEEEELLLQSGDCDNNNNDVDVDDDIHSIDVHNIDIENDEQFQQKEVEEHEKRERQRTRRSRRKRRRKRSEQTSSSSSNGNGNGNDTPPTKTKNNKHRYRSLSLSNNNNMMDDIDINDGIDNDDDDCDDGNDEYDDETETITMINTTTTTTTTTTASEIHGPSSRNSFLLPWKRYQPTLLPSSSSVVLLRAFFLVLLLTVNILFVCIHHYQNHHDNGIITINTNSMYQNTNNNNNNNRRRLYHTFESYSDERPGGGGRIGGRRLHIRRYLQDNEVIDEIDEIDPSFIPTVIPNTTIPSLSPSAIPTSMPTVSPSPTISPQPTGQPTISPSLEPSSTPTDIPTMTFAPTSPSAMPSESFLPTVTPSPTTSPTDHPTITPTSSLEPSGSPVNPSQQPSLSPAPTMTPSSQPTDQPTQSIQPSISPSISNVPTVSVSPSSSPTPFTPKPTFDMRTDTSPDIVMVLDGVPLDGLTSDQIEIWKDVTSQHVMDFHNMWTDSLWDDDGTGTPSPSTNNNNETAPSTSPSEGDLSNDDVENDDDDVNDDIPIMMSPSTRQSSPSTSSSSGTDNGNTNNNDNSLLSPFDVLNVTTNWGYQVVVEDTEGSWPNTSVVRIHYTQVISYRFKNPDLIPNLPPDNDDEMGDTGVESTQRAEYEAFRDQFLFILPFKSDSFDYSVALVDALDLESFVIVDSVAIDTGPTPPPTPAPVPEASSRAVAWSASLVVGACIIVAFLMWDRHRKNAKFKYDGDDDDDDDDENGGRSNSRRGYNTADFDNAGQPVDWTNPYSDSGGVGVGGDSRHRSRHSGAGFSAGESSVSSGERMRPPRSSGGTPGRAGNSNYGTATFSDVSGREGALNTGTFGTIGTLTTVMSSAGPTPQGSNRERDRMSDRRSGGRGAMDPGPNLPPLPLPRGEHVRTGTWSSAYETTGSSSSNHGHTRSSSGWSRGSGAYGSPVMIGHRLSGRQTSIADTELTDLTFSDTYTPIHPTSGTTFTSLNDLPSAQKFGPSDQQISINSSAPLHIPDDDSVPASNLAAENLDPSSVMLQQSIPQPLDHSSKGGIDDRDFEEDSPQPAITGFAMQIEDLE